MMGRLRPTAVLLLLVTVAGLAPAGCSRPNPPRAAQAPRLIVDGSVADDFRALAQTTWDQFLAAFAARTTCFGDVTLAAAVDLTDRAAYDPQTAVVTVRAPGTSAMLQSALIHEWAHHVEFQCAAQQEMRSAFLAAQGLPADTPWRLDDTPASARKSGASYPVERAWADRPSEQYAEAAIELVLGRRQIPTEARVSVAAVHVLEEWASGR